MCSLLVQLFPILGKGTSITSTQDCAETSNYFSRTDNWANFSVYDLKHDKDDSNICQINQMTFDLLEFLAAKVREYSKKSILFIFV